MKAPKGVPKQDDKPYEAEVIVEQPAEASDEEMEEAYYWFTINEFIGLLAQHGMDKVMGDVKAILANARDKVQKDHPIILL